MWSFKNEIGRKVIHLLILLAIGVYIAIERTYSKQYGLIFLVGLLILFLFFEWIRLDLGFEIPIFSPFIRPKERDRMYGVIYFLSGVIISLAVFDFKIAISAILMATFGDLAAAIFGKRFGLIKIYRDKTTIGFVAEVVTNLIIGFFLLINYNILIMLCMAFTASIVETFVDELDDNLLVPVIAGFVGQLIYFFI